MFMAECKPAVSRIEFQHPDGRVVEKPYKATPTQIGQRHPVTRDLPGSDASPPAWGDWLRIVEARTRPGIQPILSGAEGLPLLPGVSTASEVMQANSAGFNFLKLFPATAVGGVNLLKALAGPFPDVAFCPTGGISLQTAPDFLKLPNVKVCGGSWLTPQDAVDAKDWARITKLAAEAAALRG